MVFYCIHKLFFLGIKNYTDVNKILTSSKKYQRTLFKSVQGQL